MKRLCYVRVGAFEAVYMTSTFIPERLPAGLVRCIQRLISRQGPAFGPSSSVLVSSIS